MFNLPFKADARIIPGTFQAIPPLSAIPACGFFIFHHP